MSLGVADVVALIGTRAAWVLAAWTTVTVRTELAPGAPAQGCREGWPAGSVSWGVTDSGVERRTGLPFVDTGVASCSEARRSCQSIQGAPMIGVTVTFSYTGDFDRSRVTKVAHEARAMFEGMRGLRFKFFTFDEKRQRAVNFYIWDSEEAAEQFFSDELRERVTGLYGVRPAIEFVEIAEIVDNSAV